jgi:phage shock protein PspC (stress-responsive transcriptional regulator)
MEHKLIRSRSDSILAGVCGGLGQYLGIDSNLVRVFFVFLSVFSGLGTLIYFLLWILVPREDQAGYSGRDVSDRINRVRDDILDFTHNPNPKAASWVGIALVAAGGVFLLQALNLPFLHWLNSGVIWAAALIVGGGVLIYRTLKG